MRADKYRQLWPMSCNQVKPRSPASVKADIRGLFRVKPIHDAGMKKQNHVILVRPIVDRP